MNAPLATQIFQFIIGIAILIIVHELGHFFAARLFKVEVEEFGIGFPPRAVKLFEAGGTEFTLNWIPLGGFVRPKGENDPTVPGGLAAASPWVRLAVLFAGPTMNLLAGVVLAIIFFYNLGEPILNRVLIQDTIAGTPAEAAGLQSGDLILEVNGEPIDSSQELQQLISANQGRETELLIERDGQTLTVMLTPQTDPESNRGVIGIYMGHPTQPVTLGQAITRGAVGAYEQARGILLLPVRLLAGQASPEEGRVVGFKGMFDIYQQIPSAAYFFMAISISLGVLNLMPLPALDGGRILLTLPEILLRRRVPANLENLIHLVGFALLLGLMIYINIQDFVNPLQLP